MLVVRSAPIPITLLNSIMMIKSLVIIVLSYIFFSNTPGHFLSFVFAYLHCFLLLSPLLTAVCQIETRNEINSITNYTGDANILTSHRVIDSSMSVICLVAPNEKTRVSVDSSEGFCIISILVISASQRQRHFIFFISYRSLCRHFFNCAFAVT